MGVNLARLPACVALLLFLAPASGQPPYRGANPVAQRGVVFIADGVGGFEVMASAARWALPRAGIRHEIREFTWTHGFGQILHDLQDIRHLLGKADELAAEVTKIKSEDPDRPVYLIGKSGGTGLVLLAAEHLAPQTLERIVLLSSAVSPTYDLRPALRATKGEIVSFYSSHDRLVLGWGTTQFGSIDRVYGPSAGLRGFKVAEDWSEQDKLLYRRLVQIDWRPNMLLEGHPGSHYGTSLPGFLRNEVAPWLKTTGPFALK